MATAGRMPCRPGHPAKLSASLLLLVPWCVSAGIMRSTVNLRPTSAASIVASRSRNTVTMRTDEPRRVVVVGAGWGGLSVAHALSKSGNVHVTVVDAAPRPGGLVSDGFLTTSGTRRAEAGQHGFWGEYHNIFALLDELSISDALTGYAEQGQYSPDGLQAVWPVYREQKQELPTGIGQALYTRFLNLPLTDLATAAPLVLAFSEFDDSPEAWARYDSISFRDLCVRLGVSKRLYKEAFEPMILTGLFAPGEECSAAAALGMAYFFVLKHQTSFDVRWARGNVGEVIFAPWVEAMKARNVTFMQSTRVVGFEETADSKIGAKIDAEIDSTSAEIKSTLRPTALQSSRLSAVLCSPAGAAASDPPTRLEADNVVFAVGAAALSGLVRNSPILSRHAELRRFCNLRGTSVLATRLFLDRPVRTPYSANACWGFDEGVGMTWFDIRQLHKPAHDHEPGAVLEVDYYHSNSLLSMSDSDIVTKAKHDLDQMLGADCVAAEVIDAAVVRLPSGVNWYYPGSYKNMPDTTSTAIPNAYFVGDLVRTRHGSWSQEKAFVTGIEAANAILHRPVESGVIPLKDDETHVAFGRSAVSRVQKLLGLGDRAKGPSIADFLF